PIECAYFIQWSAAQICKGFEGAPEPLVSIECDICYGTSGTREDGSDRGRTLTALDSELLQILLPPFTEKYDYTNAGALSLKINILWTSPPTSPGDYNSGGAEIGVTTTTKLPIF